MSGANIRDDVINPGGRNGDAMIELRRKFERLYEGKRHSG